jgi:predicted transcriptional regulator
MKDKINGGIVMENIINGLKRSMLTRKLRRLEVKKIKLDAKIQKLQKKILKEISKKNSNEVKIKLMKLKKNELYGKAYSNISDRGIVRIQLIRLA